MKQNIQAIDKSWFIIVNPASGKGQFLKYISELEDIFNEKQIPFIVKISSSPRELTGLVETAIVAEGCRKIIGIGGDGTMNEIVNGIFKQKTVPTTDIVFTILPVGTGNDWAKTNNIPRNIRHFTDKILRGVTYLQDIGVVLYSDNNNEIKTHYFANAGGMAYDSFVVKSVESQKRYIFGKKFAYILHVLKCLWLYKPEPVRIKFDTETIENYFYTINIGINKTSGGGMTLTPQAVNNDGLVALTLIRNLPKWKVLYYTTKLYNGNIGKIKGYVSLHQTQNIRIESLGNPILIETDGELLGQTPIEITILQKVLRIIDFSFDK